jgi:hypothetical protein
LLKSKEFENLEDAVKSFVNIAGKEFSQYKGLENRLQQLHIDIDKLLEDIRK